MNTQIDKESEIAFHDQLTELLRQRIIAGDWQPGSKIPSERDLALEYGVSRITAQNAVLGLLKEGLVIRASGKGTFIKKSVDPGSLGRNSQNIIAFVLNRRKNERTPILKDAVFHALLQGIQEELKQFSYQVIFSNIDDNEIEEIAHFNDLLSKIDGIVFAELTSANLLEIARNARIPAIITYPEIDGLCADSVGVDIYKGAYDAVSLLISKGHRRIGIINGPMHLLQASERFRGYKAALKSAGIPFDPSLVSGGEGWQIEHGRVGMSRLLDNVEHPSAVFGVNDLLAIGAMKVLQERGLVVPDEMSVIGSDDIDLALHSRPPLTTLNININSVARYAARMLLERIENPSEPLRHVEFDAELIIRGSCSSPGKTNV